MYGEALAYGIADKSVQETYEADVLKSETSQGQPQGQPQPRTLSIDQFDARESAPVAALCHRRPEVGKRKAPPRGRGSCAH